MGVGARVTGLLPHTTYHFRMRATNASGTTTGADRSFTTAKTPLGLTLGSSTPRLRYGSALTLTGTATGTDRRGIPITLERRGFPFTAGFRPFGAQQLTDAAGLVRFAVPPFSAGSQFRLTAPGRGLQSAPVTVEVVATVRLRLQRLSRGRLRLRGIVAPGGATGTGSLQRLGADGRWRTVRRTALVVGRDLSRCSFVLRERSTPTSYRLTTRLTGGALGNGRSLPRRVAVR